MPLARLVSELVERVEPAFAAAGHAPDALTDIAHDALTSARAHERVGLADVLAWLGTTTPLPAQDLASGFGEPPITLHTDGRWGIQLLAWVEGRTSTHEHDFAGAFTVLEGASFERRFRFASEDPEDAPLRLGQLRLLDVSLLARGDVRPIAAGSALIHSTFHIERPTLSLVVRTEGGVLAGDRQFDFWGPHVALDPAFVEPRVARQVAMLALLVRAGREWEPFAASVLEQNSLHTAFRVIDLLIGLYSGAPLLPSIRACVVARHGELALSRMLASIAEGRWEHVAALRHAACEQPEHRFFLGALLAAPDREGVLELVRARWPDEDPRACVRRWVSELVRIEAGSADSSLVARYDRAVKGFLAGRSRPDVAAELRAHPRPRHHTGTLGEADAFIAALAAGPLRALTVARGPEP